MKTKFKVVLVCISFMCLVSCQKSSSTDIPSQQHNSSEGTSIALSTSNSEADTDEWFVALIQNYLNDEASTPNEGIELSVQFSDENGYITDRHGIIYIQSENISPEINCVNDLSNGSFKCISTVYSAQTVSLVTEDSGSHKFATWSGVTCVEGQASKRCTFELVSDTNVIANYQSVPKVSVTLADASLTHTVNEINSSNNQIVCQDGFDLTCIGYYTSGSIVTLETEGTTVYSLFSGWSGVNCNEGQQANTCTFVVTDHLNIVANYDYTKLTVRQNGSTTDNFALRFANNPDPNIIYVPSIYCDSDVLASVGKCEAVLRNNLEVKLVLEGTNNSSVNGFSSWSGVTCAEGQTTHDCTFTTQPLTEITLNFSELATLTVNVIDPMSLDPYITNDSLTLWCQPLMNPSPCTSQEVNGSTVTLYADGGPIIKSWSGVTCSEGQNSQTCTFVIQGDTQVTAIYE